MAFPAFTRPANADSVGLFASDAIPNIGGLSTGPIRVLYIGEPSFTTSVCSAVAERMETDHRVFAVSGGMLPADVSATSDERFAELAAMEWDAIWLAINPAALPSVIRESIFGMVSGGAGLVYAGLKDEIRQFVSDGADSNPFKAAFNNTVKTDIAGKRGQGVIVAVNPVRFGDRIIDERYLFATMNSLLSVSKRRSGLDLTGIQFAGKSITQESMTMMNYRVDLINNSQPRQMDIRQRFIDKYGRVAFERSERFNVTGGRSFMLLDYPFLPAGEYSFELVFADDAGAVAIGGASFEVTSETRLTALYPWYPSAPNGGFIPCTLELSTTILADMRFEAELVDMYGRVIDRSTPAANPGWKSSTFTLHAVDVPGRMATLRVYYWRSTLLVDIMETPIFIEKHYNPHDFSFVADDGSLSDFFRERSLRRLSDSGAGWIVSRMTAYSPGIQYQRGADILAAGAGILPLIDSLPDIDPGAAYALADTLRHFTPPAYVLSDGYSSVNALPDDFESIHTALVRADSTVRVGMNSFSFNSPADVERITGVSDLIIAEEPDSVDEAMPILTAIGAFSWPDAITGTTLHEPEATGVYVRELPWRNLFAGLNSIWFRSDENAGGFDILDGGLTPSAAVTMETVSEIGEGIGRLILGAEPVQSPEWLHISSGSDLKESLVSRVFRDGETWLVGLLLPMNAGLPEAEIKIEFPMPGTAPAVYDVRKSEFLGVTSFVSLDLEAGEAVVLALCPEAVREVAISGVPPILSPGQSFIPVLSVRNRAGAEAAGRRVFRIDLTGPDGPRPWMTKIAETGPHAGEESFFIAHNDPAGQWTLSATDIVSGRSIDRRFIVRRTIGPGAM